MNEFVEDATRLMERQDKSFIVLDITDPLAENQLVGEESRFDPSVQERPLKQNHSSEAMSFMLAGKRTSYLLQLSLKLQHDVEPGRNRLEGSA